MEKKLFKAIIRVVKSIVHRDDVMGFDTVDVLREPIIEAIDKNEVKKILLEKYPQFFQNGKVYEKETKDQAQFFYVVIFELYAHEIAYINEGEWRCDHCGHVHENKYLSRPIISRKFEGKMFCGGSFSDGGELIGHSCYDLWKKAKYRDEEMPDDVSYVNDKSPNYIYKVTEKLTGKSYIGKTRNAPFFRWWNHLTHSSSPFGLYLRDTKLSEWTFEVLEELPSTSKESDVLLIESQYMVKYDSIKNGFNSLISNKSVNNTNQNTPTLF